MANQGNVVEASAILSYAVFQINHIAMTAANQMGGNEAEGVVTFATFLKMLSKGKDGNSPLPPAVIGLYVDRCHFHLQMTTTNHANARFDAGVQLGLRTFGAAIDFVSAAAFALPLTVLVGLFYRLTVLYMASRIIVDMKKTKQSSSYEQKIPRSSSQQELNALSLKEESAVRRFFHS